MDKKFITYGNGTEHLENLMNDPRFQRPSMYDSATKYLEEFKRCKELGLTTSEEELDEIYGLFMKTFQEKTHSAEEAERYKTAFDESWRKRMRNQVRQNPARALYYREQVVNSLSFYDALRRIYDPEIPNATVLEAAFAITHDIVGNYGKLALDDPSTLWDMFEPIMVEDRWRTWKVVSSLIRLLDSRTEQNPRVVSFGCGFWPEVRHYGFTLEMLKQIEFVGIDREFHEKELNKVFQYAHGVNFADTKIRYIQDEVNAVAERGKLKKFGDYGYAMGVLSYAENDDVACRLLDSMLSMIGDSRYLDFDVQTLDDSLRCKSIVFGWSEEFPLRPDANKDVAIERWNRNVERVDAKVVECEVDPRNDPAVGVYYRIVRK